MTQLHWFVKIPRSLQTVAMDERELVMYNTIFPRLKTFIKENLKPGGRDRMCQKYKHQHHFVDEKLSLPIPTIYFSSFMGDGINDCLVIENLCADSHFQVRPGLLLNFSLIFLVTG